jgi:hypothetical protein
LNGKNIHCKGKDGGIPKLIFLQFVSDRFRKQGYELMYLPETETASADLTVKEVCINFCHEAPPIG